MEVIKKSIIDWAYDEGYKILDPDGFDRTEMDVMTKLRTKEEFDKGFGNCTIIGIKK